MIFEIAIRKCISSLVISIEGVQVFTSVCTAFTGIYIEETKKLYGYWQPANTFVDIKTVFALLILVTVHVYGNFIKQTRSDCHYSIAM